MSENISRIREILENATEIWKHGEDGSLYLQKRLYMQELEALLAIIEAEQQLDPDVTGMEQLQIIRNAINIKPKLSKKGA